MSFLGRVPVDPNLVRCTEEGRNFLDMFASSPVSEVYRNIISALVGESQEEMEVEN